MSIEKYPNLFKTMEIRGHVYRNRLIADAVRSGYNAAMSVL